MLKQEISERLKDAMKSGDTMTRDTLRMLDSMIKNEEIATDKREDGLNDDAIIAIVKRAIKQRTDSAKQYHDGGRDELAQQEEAEIVVLNHYLPAQMSASDIETVVVRVIKETGATSPQDMGKVMSSVMKEVGANADGTLVRECVSCNLSA